MSARGTIRDGALWGSAAAVVLAAHLGGAVWVMRHAEAAAPAGLPDPVFVELAPAPEAAAPPEETESPEIAEAAPEPEPEPEPEPAPDFVMDEPEMTLPPLPEMNTQVPPPADAVVLQSPRPKRRPDRPEPEPERKIVEKEPEPKKVEQKKEKAEQEQPARQASTTVRAKQSDRTAAPQAQRGVQPSAKQVATWEAKVQTAVNRHMQRARLRQGGVRVTVNFTINANGSVSNGRVGGSTGDARTDTALARQAASLPRLPAHPSGKAIPITLPVTIKN